MTALGDGLRRLHWRLRHGQDAWRDLQQMAEEALRHWATLRRGSAHPKMRPDAPIFGQLDDALAEAERSLGGGQAEKLVEAVTRAERLAGELLRCDALWTTRDLLEQELATHYAELPLEVFDDLPSLTGCKALRDSVTRHLESGRLQQAEADLHVLQGIVQRWQGTPRSEDSEGYRRTARLTCEGVTPERVESLQVVLRSPLASLGEQLLDELQMQMPSVFSPPDRSPWRRRQGQLLEQAEEVNRHITGWLKARSREVSEKPDEGPEASSSAPGPSTGPFQLGRFH